MTNFVLNYVKSPDKMSETEDTKVQFKRSSKKRPARVKIPSESSGDEEKDEELNLSEFEKTKQLQRLRKRTAGTNIVTLALGKKISKVANEFFYPKII